MIKLFDVWGIVNLFFCKLLSNIEHKPEIRKLQSQRRLDFFFFSNVIFNDTPPQMMGCRLK